MEILFIGCNYIDCNLELNMDKEQKMYKFTTIKCSNCGTVIFNLPEMEAKKLSNLKLLCEDCNYNTILKDYNLETVCTISLKEIRYSA
jgi:uncharacterized OB-fold protein